MSEPNMAPGMWCHIEIPSNDPEKSKAFCGGVFGWTFQDMPMDGGTYTLPQGAAR